MRKIIVNGRFLSRRITGVERYGRELLNELDGIILPGELEIAIPPSVKVIPEYRNIKVKEIGRKKGILWEQTSFPLYVRKVGGTSLNFCNTAPLSNPGIVCIHDMKIKARPQDFSPKFVYWYRFLFRNETRRANRIITVSNFSKNEICKYYSVSSDRIAVIPNAWQHFDRIPYDENTLSKYSLEKEGFFFSMSSMEPNKNFRWVAEAARKNETRIFAVAGSINTKVFSDNLGFDCPENMKLLGYVTDEEAKTLMRDCTAFLFPTFYEGFGIPPLEAMSSGSKRIIVSNTAIMHEIFEDSVDYIDPYAEPPKMSSCEKKISEKKRREILQKYNWSKSAESLLELIRTVEN